MAKSFIGTVSSAKPDKTIVVTVVGRKTHPIYKKQYRVSKKYMAHDEKNEALEGDRVVIVETRPLSARKTFMLEKILDRPAISTDQTVDKLAELTPETEDAQKETADKGDKS
jgi:small subunit ribosomal protein S17